MHTHTHTRAHACTCARTHAHTQLKAAHKRMLTGFIRNSPKPAPASRLAEQVFKAKASGPWMWSTPQAGTPHGGLWGGAGLPGCRGHERTLWDDEDAPHPGAVLGTQVRASPHYTHALFSISVCLKTGAQELRPKGRPPTRLGVKNDGEWPHPFRPTHGCCRHVRFEIPEAGTRDGASTPTR